MIKFFDRLGNDEPISENGIMEFLEECEEDCQEILPTKTKTFYTTNRNGHRLRCTSPIKTRKADVVAPQPTRAANGQRKRQRERKETPPSTPATKKRQKQNRVKELVAQARPDTPEVWDLSSPPASSLRSRAPRRSLLVPPAASPRERNYLRRSRSTSSSPILRTPSQARPAPRRRRSPQPERRQPNNDTSSYIRHILRAGGMYSSDIGQKLRDDYGITTRKLLAKLDAMRDVDVEEVRLHTYWVQLIQ